MNHYSDDEWLKYIRDELEEKDREKAEDHLYSCDTCLEEYLLALSAHESSFPILSDESVFTDAVMLEVSKLTEENQTEFKSTKLEKKKKPYYQQVAFHYFLAAAATLMLMLSGVFQSLASYASSIEGPKTKEVKPSVTEGMIDKTFAWMDSLEKKEANKK
jgi:anti-sigma factor RsiW